MKEKILFRQKANSTDQPKQPRAIFQTQSKKKNKVATKETHSFNSHPNKQQIHPKTGEIQSPKATQNFILDGTLTFFIVQQRPASNALQIPFSLQQPPWPISSFALQI